MTMAQLRQKRQGFRYLLISSACGVALAGLMLLAGFFVAAATLDNPGGNLGAAMIVAGCTGLVCCGITAATSAIVWERLDAIYRKAWASVVAPSPATLAILEEMEYLLDQRDRQLNGALVLPFPVEMVAAAARHRSEFGFGLTTQQACR